MGGSHLGSLSGNGTHDSKKGAPYILGYILAHTNCTLFSKRGDTEKGNRKNYCFSDVWNIYEANTTKAKVFQAIGWFL